MASYLIAKRIDKRLANDISRSHNSHWHGDLYRSRAAAIGQVSSIVPVAATTPAAAATPSLRLATLSITPFIISLVGTPYICGRVDDKFIARARDECRSQYPPDRISRFGPFRASLFRRCSRLRIAISGNGRRH